jgi:hypothetical protein
MFGQSGVNSSCEKIDYAIVRQHEPELSVVRVHVALIPAEIA